MYYSDISNIKEEAEQTLYLAVKRLEVGVSVQCMIMRLKNVCKKRPDLCWGSKYKYRNIVLKLQTFK